MTTRLRRYWRIDAESALPEHTHPHEQIASVIDVWHPPGEDHR